MKRGAASLALLLACLPRPLAADTYPRQAGVDAIHYVFRLALHDDTDEITGEASIQLRFLGNGVRQVALDLASPAEGKGMTVTAVTSQDRPLAFTHAADRLSITLPELSVAGRDFTITIRYSGIPAGGLHIGKNHFGERTFFSENWPDKARQWLPMIDHPYDKATGELVVTAPAEYQVVANGLLLEQTDLPGGQRRTHWRQAVPISSWLYAVGAARFAVHHAEPVNGIPLQSWVFPQDRDEVVAGFEGTARAALLFFAEHVGPYAYEKLANVQAAGMKGGTEHASSIFYGESSVTGRPIVGLVAHEIAHQWFGDSVTERDWDDVWLSEGFATYFTLLFMEHTQGRDAFVTGLKSSRERVLALELEHPDSPVIHRNLSDMKKVTNQLIYQKGAWTLHMLRRLIGDDAFWNGIREYYRRYRDQNASTDDFRQVMEQASGRDLREFLRQWLERSGVPRIGGTWRFDAERKQVEVTLAQEQAGEPFRLPIEIGLGSGPGATTRIERVEIHDHGATFAFPADSKPTSVILDPDTWLLMEAGPFTKTQ
jgi:aminopeptidase N